MPFNLSSIQMDSGLPFCALYEADPKQNHGVWLGGFERKDGMFIEQDHPFSKILVDHTGNYWLAGETVPSVETAELCVFNQRGELLKSLTIPGNRPNLFEYRDSVFVGCEGGDTKAHIYEFAKDSLTQIEQWTVDGFFWSLEKSATFLYVTCYLPDENLAVLYILSGEGRATVELGGNFFPTDLLLVDGTLYVTACPVTGSTGKRIIQLDAAFETVREFELTAGPRRIYPVDSGFVVYARELGAEKKEQLIYFDLEAGTRKEYAIPYADKVRGNAEGLFFLNSESHSILLWDHEKREVTKGKVLPGWRNRNVVDFQFAP